MGRRLKALNLMIVSIIMLMASVFPHHHHGERLCVRNVVENVSDHCSDKGHTDRNTYPIEDHHSNSCNTTCITHMVLAKADVASDFTVDFSLFTVVYSIYDELFNLACTDQLNKQNFAYIESLFPQCIVSIRGLRAPPTDWV